MNNHTGVDSGCLLVAEYVDEGAVPTDLAFHPGEVVRPHVVGSYLDIRAGDDAVNEAVTRTLLQVIQTETDGPSRAKMVEWFTRLQALNTMREILRCEPAALKHGLLDHMAEVVAPGSEDLRGLVAALLEMLRAQKQRQE